jgi:prepilin-type N-terminal cleavage/methylation domain-containing protein
MRQRKAYSLIELIIVVLILAALSFVAVPRLQYAAVHRQRSETVARKIVTDLRRTRSLAILHAADNNVGFAINMSGSPPYSGYQIVNLSDSSVIDSHSIGSSITCSGGSQFKFGPLGNLKTGSGTQLTVTADSKTCTVTIVSATGMVKCVEN